MPTHVRRASLLALPLALLLVRAVSTQAPLREAHAEDDFTVREEMVPMRDGVKLYTLILAPKAAARRFRSCSSERRTTRRASSPPAPRDSPWPWVDRMLDGGYIFVFQDLRGRFRSEGDYAMYRVPRGAYNQTTTDETTDAWDTIDWLVKHVPANTGKVGVWGTSYPGWLTLAAMRDPHPALAAAVPFNPVVDVWKADDWFHWGAFRFAYSFDFIYAMESRKGQNVAYPYGSRDLYAWLLPQGSAEQALGGRVDARHEMWRRLVENPSYTQYWRDCAADRWFDRPSRSVPALTVHGLWDQEDIYGAPAAYAALERLDPANDHNFFAAGPWYHGQHFAEGSRLGALTFDEDTARRFREDVLTPFLRRFLKGENVRAPAPVNVFETGTNRWRQFDRWPPAAETRRLYLQAGGGARVHASRRGSVVHRVHLRPREAGAQRATPALGLRLQQPGINRRMAPLARRGSTIRGRPSGRGHMDGRAARRAADGPRAGDGAPLGRDDRLRRGLGREADRRLSGRRRAAVRDVGLRADGQRRHLPRTISRELRRAAADRRRTGRSRTRCALPHVNHTFRAGHRLMVQVQSTWFPLYDRNPQTFVPSIMTAPPSAYTSQRHRVHHGGPNATYLDIYVDR